MHPGIKIGFIALGAIFALSVVGGAFYQVDQQERAVILTNGAFSSDAAPGLGMKIPFIQSVKTFPVNQQVTHWGADAPLQAYSFDQQPADLQLSVSWHIDPSQIREAYSTYGTIEAVDSRNVQRNVPQAAKTIFGQFTAATSIQERQKLNNALVDEIKKEVKAPVIVDSVQLENIDFSDAYEKGIESRMLAQVEVQKLNQQADQARVQATIRVTQAQAEADASVAKAKAAAEATRLAGMAEADAIKARGDALRENPNLVELIAAEHWNGQLPTTMVPNAALPFVNVK